MTLAEGNAGTTDFVFTVTLDPVSDQTVTVDYKTTDGSAVAPEDYAAIATTTLTFDPGDDAKTITVLVNGDTVVEADQDFTVDLSNATGGAQIADAQGLGTILNDDGTLLVSIDDVTQPEGTDTSTDYVFTISISGETSEDVVVNYATADGTATVAASDYADTSDSVTFTPGGALTQAVTVPVTADNIYERDETFFVDISIGGAVPVGGGDIVPLQLDANISKGRGVGTIENDDAPPTLAVTASVGPEGASGDTTPFPFSVVLTGPTEVVATVNVATADGTATEADNDYTGIASQQLTFTPGSPTTQTLSVPVIGDNAYERDEIFSVKLSGAVDANITGDTAPIIIQNDDALPTFDVSGARGPEGNQGDTTGFVGSVVISGETKVAAIVTVSTSDGSATEADSDYTGIAPQQLTFTPGGATTQTISVPVIGDNAYEHDESFLLSLSGPTDAVIGTGTAPIIIENDDTAPVFTISGASNPEGAQGDTTPFGAAVVLTGETKVPAVVNLSTVDGTATTADSDYTGITNQQLTFNPGEPTTQTVNVTVIGDNAYERDEGFSVALSSATDATVSPTGGTATMTITNDDDPPTISIASVTDGPEGNLGDTPGFVGSVVISGETKLAAVVNVSTSDGTATTADNDYTAITNQTVTFTPGGATTQNVTVTVVGDNAYELDETFTLSLSGPTDATIGTGTATATIENDDTAPVFSVTGVTLPEGNQGTTTPFGAAVVLTGETKLAAVVSLSTVDGTATTADNDYAAITNQQLTVNPGEATTQTVNVDVSGDNTYESAEGVGVSLSGAAGATISPTDGTATLTITTDDAPPTIAIDNVTRMENADSPAPTTIFTFTVTITGATDVDASVNFATADGEAKVALGDYLAANGTLDFPAGGATTQTIDVTVNDDALFEPDETFEVNLSGAVDATIVDGQGIGTILNDDPPIPDPASGLTHTAVTLASITWQWTDNSNNEDGFHVQDENGATLNTVGPGVTTWTETGLAANTAYTRQVVAYNATGEAAPSNQHTACTAIETPTAVTFPGASNTTIDLLAEGGPFSNLATPDSGILFEETGGSNGGINQWVPATTDQATGLIPNTQYTFRAKARNCTQDETGYTPPAQKYTLATQPGASAYTSVGTTSVTAHWTAGTPPNPAGTNYFVACTRDSDGDPAGDNGWAAETTHVFNGLTPNTRYTCAVKARNGESIETNPTSLGSVLTDAAVPKAGAFDEINATNIEVSWDPNGNPAGTQYRLRVYSPDANGTEEDDTGWITETGVDVTGLTPNTSYCFKVMARNADGKETAEHIFGSGSVYTKAAVPGQLVVDMQVTDAGGKLNPNAPACRTLGILSIDLNGNPDATPIAIGVGDDPNNHLGNDPNSGWLRVGDPQQGEDPRDLYANGAAPEYHDAAFWASKRLRGLNPDTLHEFKAQAVNALNDPTVLTDVGDYRTNVDGDVNRSGTATAWDYALARTDILNGGSVGNQQSWANDINDDRRVNVIDLTWLRWLVLNP